MAKKMQWLIDAINKKETSKIFKFKLSDSKETIGTICMPTGTGKSGVMIENIISTINAPGPDIRIINISCPTLRLAEQFITDLFEVIDRVISTFDKSNTCLVINSSDLPSNYHTYGMSVYSGELFESLKTAIKENHFIIVASCHKSMQKFIETYRSVLSEVDDYIKFKRKNIDFVELHNYIDESHMLSSDSIIHYSKSTKVDLMRLKDMSDSLYLFSATPDLQMTKMLNPDLSAHYIYKMYAVDAIHSNLILPPRIRCFRTPNMSNIPLFEYVLEESKKYGGNRKILITLKSTKELRRVLNVLEANGYKVFSACAAYGFTGEEGLTDAVKFAEAVDKWNGDCFVLQIKQLTQGTDIKTLTDCVIPISNDINPKTYRHVLQTMGRVMRTAPGERGLSYNQRTKKAGNVFFVVLPNADIEKENSLRRFALRYYGMECTLYGEGFSIPAEMTCDIENTKSEIQKYIIKNRDCIEFDFKVLGNSIDTIAAEILEKTDAELYGLCVKNIPEYHLLDNRQLLEYTKTLLNTFLII